MVMANAGEGGTLGSVSVRHLTTPRCKVGTSPGWEDRSGAGPALGAERTLISSPRGDGSLGKNTHTKVG